MKPFSFIALGFLFLSLTVPSLADPLSVKPYVSIKQGYSDNILFQVDDEKSDSITTLSAGLAVKQRKERLKTSFNAQMNQLVYWHYDELNDQEYNVKGAVDYDLTERLGARASAGYVKNTRRDEDSDGTGLLTGDRRTASISMGGDYMVSEISQVDLSVAFKNVDLEDDNENEDNDSISIDFSFNRNLSEWFKNTVGIFNLNYLRYTSDSEDIYDTTISSIAFDRVVSQEYEADIFQFSAGFSHDITELYNVYFLVGGSYTDSSQKKVRDQYFNSSTGSLALENPSTETQSDTFGGVLSTGVNYKDEYYDIGLSLSHDVRGGTGTSTAVERTTLSGSLSRKLSSELSLTFKASCYLNQNDSDTGSDTDELTINVQPGFRYKLAQDFILSGSYRYTSEKDRENDSTTERSLVYIQLRKEFELD